MQILGKRSKVILIAVAIAMLVAVGVSFAMWDMSAVKATNGDLSDYANAKVGDVIEFGRYYQTGKKVNDVEDAEYEKTPIEWIVVDKDERTGQITLMSKYILAAGSYFGNLYYNNSNVYNWHYSLAQEEIAGVLYNQAYVDSTARAFLNNLERRDLGGDSYSKIDGYKLSTASSDIATGKLLTSVGFSNRKYTFIDEYKRPISNEEYRNRPATRGFYDEAFTDSEKEIIKAKAISGYTGHRWPNNENSPTKMTYVEGSVDKVWLPSASELNIMNVEDDYTNPSDEASSTAFEYFQGKTGDVLRSALKTKRTEFVFNDSKAMNYSIPVYKYQSTEINEDISTTKNSTDYYWTRSPMSRNNFGIRCVTDTGALISNDSTDKADIGVRPCIILQY